MNIPANWSMQVLRTWPRIPSGMCSLRKANLISAIVTVGTGTPKVIEVDDVIPLSSVESEQEMHWALWRGMHCGQQYCPTSLCSPL